MGGGFAGVKAALELKNKAGIEVELISKHADFEYHSALYRTATGHSPLEVVFRLGDLFKSAKNVEVVLDKIVALNTKVKAVKGESGQVYRYDKLLLCMGNEKNFYQIPGLDTYAHTMYTIRDTIDLRGQLTELFRVPHSSRVRVIVIGAGASGVELCGDLQHYAREVAQRYTTKQKTLEIELIEGGPRVLPLLSEKASEKARKRLQKIGVLVRLNSIVLECGQNIVKLSDEERAADIIIWTAGSKNVDFFAKYPEVFELERGKVRVGEHLSIPKAPDVFVLGDNALTPYSGMAQTALYDAAYVAKYIHFLSQATSSKSFIPYKVKKPIYAIPIGTGWAVVDNGKKVRSGRVGWLIRRRADSYMMKNFEPYKKAFVSWYKKVS